MYVCFARSPKHHDPHCATLYSIGRLDDVIVLSSGEKLVPVAQENFLSARPLIKGAVMFGRGQNEPGLLLEPTLEAAFDPKDEEKLIKYRNAVW